MKPEVSLEDLKRLDLRVVKVLEAERIPGLSKVLKLRVDIGGEVRDIVAGGAEFYSPEYFKGRVFIAIVNLREKHIGGVVSRGMLLAADLGGKPVWLTVMEDVPPGTKVK
ncbi:MAG: tRNA-binding protein [Candidatus Nezhaarchaeota archaeon]|nr:tRNA-binding protein [Candidatus Nezhaarchaeota archaeon]